MTEKEFKPLVDELLERIAKLQFRNYTEVKGIITEFKRLSWYSKNQYILEGIDRIEYDFWAAFSNKNDKKWYSTENELESAIQELTLSSLYIE